ncbi:MAG: hypothetical protein V3S41_06435 [Spirochaetia bacterium]
MNEMKLSDSSLGQIRHFISLARQDLEDWHGFEAEDQYGLEAYRYQIAFMAYAIALFQYHTLPAYRELLAGTVKRLIVRLIQKPVWEFWEEVSRGAKLFDPDWTEPAQPWRDPIREKNIMYSGHVAHMIALYEMLYRDFSWESSDSLRFSWDQKEEFLYDQPSVMETLYRAMMHGPSGGIECEPNLVFPECNQHPVLAFMLNDSMHGTSYSEARHRFLRLFNSAPMIDPKTHEVIFCYRVKQGTIISKRHPETGLPDTFVNKMKLCCSVSLFDSASACGWTGAFMNAWEPDKVRRHYEYQRDHHVRRRRRTGVSPARDTLFGNLGVGLFATLAVEMGDTETAEQLLDYANGHYHSVWTNGSLSYPKRPDDPGSITNLAGKMIALARANTPDGIRKLHTAPWSDSDFSHPLLEKIDYPAVLVRAAHWSPEQQRLFAILEPGDDAPAIAEFQIGGVDYHLNYAILIDGEPFARVAFGDDGKREKASFIDRSSIRVRVPLPRSSVVTVHVTPAA